MLCALCIDSVDEQETRDSHARSKEASSAELHGILSCCRKPERSMQRSCYCQSVTREYMPSASHAWSCRGQNLSAGSLGVSIVSVGFYTHIRHDITELCIYSICMVWSSNDITHYISYFETKNTGLHSDALSRKLYIKLGLQADASRNRVIYSDPFRSWFSRKLCSPLLPHLQP